MLFCISVFVTFVHAASNLKSLNHKINYKKKWAHEILTRKFQTHQYLRGSFGPTKYRREKISEPRNTHEVKVVRW